MRLLRRNNWFYSGTWNFQQSSVQGINLQTTLGGGVGRYLQNSNRESLYVLGGFAWQNAQYKTYTTGQRAQNAAAGLLESELNSSDRAKSWLKSSQWTMTQRACGIIFVADNSESPP